MPTPSSRSAAAPESFDAFLALLAAGDAEGALAACHRALVATAEPGRWRLGQTWAEMGIGKLDLAFQSVLAAARDGADEVLVGRTFAALYLRRGQLAQALEAAEYAYRLDDEDEASYQLLLRVRSAQATSAGSTRTASPLDTTLPDRQTRDADRSRSRSRLTLARAPAASHPGPQLEALYGRSLFGAWDAHVDPVAAPGWTRALRASTSWRRPVLTTLAASLALGLVFVGREALERRTEQHRREAAHHLTQILHSGAVEQLPEHLDPARGLSGLTVDDDSPLARLVARAHATAYRLHDVEPSHLRAIARAARGASWSQSYDAVVTEAFLAPVADRLAMLPRLRAVESSAPDDAQAAFLIATAALRAGDLVTAREAITRALLRLMEDSSLRDGLSSEGRRFVEENIRWDLYAERMAAEFARVSSAREAKP